MSRLLVLCLYKVWVLFSPCIAFVILILLKIILGTVIGPVQAQPPQPPAQLQVSTQQLPSQTPQPPSQHQRLSPLPQQSVTVIKPNASPRPSILRKRDIDGYSFFLFNFHWREILCAYEMVLKVVLSSPQFCFR